jgi:hypothetical protein
MSLILSLRHGLFCGTFSVLLIIILDIMNTPENNFSNEAGGEDFVKNLSPEDQQKWEENKRIFNTALESGKGGLQDVMTFLNNDQVSEAARILRELYEKAKDQE